MIFNQSKILQTMKNCYLLFFFLTCSFLLSAQIEIELEEVASGFDDPVDITNAGADDDRLFVVEQDGRIKIVNPGTSSHATFMDIDDRVTSGGESGLLGLAFHPDYANNGFFFVNYTRNGGDTRISRFSVMPNNPDQGDPDSEVVLMTIEQPYWNHNGGGIKFGADGYLYIGMGDGGSGGDPQNFSQNRQSLLGKMLRIDINTTTYGVPLDNPFVNDPNTLNEIWAIGVRNPWRFSFDRETGDMWMGDVGQSAREEVNFQAANSTGGENYGWRCYEGENSYNTGGCGSSSDYEFPVFTYNNTGSVGCSITGGFIYRGAQYPDIYGVYFVGDYCSGRIWALENNGDGTWNDSQVLDIESNQLSTFGEDSDGELYLAKHGQGRIFKITTPLCNGLTLDIQATNESCVGDADGTVNLSVQGSTDYTLEWNPPIPDANAVAAGTYTLTVNFNNGCVQTEQVNISTSPAPPTPTITEDGSTLTAPAGYAYQWFLDGTAIDGATTQSIENAVTGGSYTVEITDDNGCSATSDALVDISDIEGINKLQVNPNPFDEVIALTINATQQLDIMIQLTDISGKLLLEKTLNVTSQNDFYEINVADIPIGVYTLTVQSTKGSFSKKMVKQ